MSYFRKKAMTNKQPSHLHKHLNTIDLILLGLGAIVGTGIFVITGTAAAKNAGPSLVLSFFLAAISVILAGLCYGEFASRIPASGGVYTYMYVIFGEIFGWFAGWFLLCEYLLACASVASGWSGYVQGFLQGMGIQLPTFLSTSRHDGNGGMVDIIAVLITILVTFLVSKEAKKVFKLNNFMVLLKFSLIALFIIVGIFYVEPNNWQPFTPYGISGITTGAAIVFFAFLGFDAVSMAAEEVKDPQKSLPKGMIGSILIATILYAIVTLVMTGMVPFKLLDVKDPVAFVMRYTNHPVIGSIISVGAIMTLLTVMISIMYSLSRMVYSIAKDGLLPKFMSKIHPKTYSPQNATFVLGGIVALFAGFIPLENLAKLTNIVTLFILLLVSVGILKLRKDHGAPKEHEFKTPFVPILPIASVVVCFYLMTQLSLFTWILFGFCILVGLLIYVGYGYRNSHFDERK